MIPMPCMLLSCTQRRRVPWCSICSPPPALRTLYCTRYSLLLPAAAARSSRIRAGSTSSYSLTHGRVGGVGCGRWVEAGCVGPSYAAEAAAGGGLYLQLHQRHLCKWLWEATAFMSASMPVVSPACVFCPPPPPHLSVSSAATCSRAMMRCSTPMLGGRLLRRFSTRLTTSRPACSNTHTAYKQQGVERTAARGCKICTALVPGVEGERGALVVVVVGQAVQC